MIETDGKPTIASKRSDPWLKAALDAGGHLADDVAGVLLAAPAPPPPIEIRTPIEEGLAATLVSDHPELDGWRPSGSPRIPATTGRPSSGRPAGPTSRPTKPKGEQMDLFTNRRPTPEQAEILDTITREMLLAADTLESLLPASRFRSLALTKLEECSMWAKKATVFTVEPINAPDAE